MGSNTLRLLLAGSTAWLLLAIAGCTSSHLEPPEIQGPIAMVKDGSASRVWVLSKQEEVHTVSVGGGSRQTGTTRDDTYFHFDLKAYDPITTRPLWTRHLVTIGDPDPKGFEPSRVIGSAAEGQLLGQDGSVVWLLIDNSPMALNAADGSVLADAAALEQRNPTLKGLLPREAKLYGFDQGLVLTSADARRLVIRGPGLLATPYAPTPAAQPEPDRMANGRERVVPSLPMGEVLARQVLLGGQWLGLYSEKEAADVLNDSFGDKYRYPYSVIDEGSLVRRGFWRGRVIDAQRFDDKFQRLADLAPVANAPTYIRGRFLKDPATGKALILDAPAGVVVWHSTRIDNAGRLALTRLGADLHAIWTTELPVSENSIATPMRYWLLPGHIIVSGVQESVVDGTTQRELHLVSVQLADGARQAWNLHHETAVP